MQEGRKKTKGKEGKRAAETEGKRRGKKEKEQEKERPGKKGREKETG